MQNQLLAEIGKLSIAERIILVEDIWDGIADSDEPLELLADDQKNELDRRIDAYRDNPKAGRSWNEIKSEILGPNR
jgi:putative addiction module component (TIGR02574 family)